jgi:hypothetical protein
MGRKVTTPPGNGTQPIGKESRRDSSLIAAPISIGAIRGKQDQQKFATPKGLNKRAEPDINERTSVRNGQPSRWDKVLMIVDPFRDKKEEKSGNPGGV